MPPTASGPLGSVHFLRHWNGRTADVVVRLILRGTSTAEENDVNDAPTPKRLCAAAAAPPRSSAHDDDDKPQLGEQTIKESGEKQEEEPTHAQPSGGPGRVLREVCAHSLLLTEGSDYLASRLEGPWSEEQPQGVVDVLLESEEEEEAAVLVLKTMYCPRDEVAPPRGEKEPTLLQVLCVADRLGAQRAMEAACLVLNKMPVWQWQTTASIFQLPFWHTTSAAAFDKLARRAITTLMAEMCDLELCWQSEEKRARLLGLPLEAFKHLLSSSKTRACEDSVFYTLAAWLDANPGCSADERNALGKRLRLPHVSPMYLGTVASVLLPKLVPAMSIMDVLMVATYANVTDREKDQLHKSGRVRFHVGRPRAKRPPSECNNTLEWGASLRLLRLLYSEVAAGAVGGSKTHPLPPHLLFRGICYRLVVFAKKVGDGGVTLLFGLQAFAPPGSGRELAGVATVMTLFEVAGEVYSQEDMWSAEVREGGGELFLPGELHGLGAMRQWDEAFVRRFADPDGRVQLRCTFGSYPVE